MKSCLFGCVVIHALCCWLTCTCNIYYDESDLGKVCLKKDSRCYDYGIAEFGSVERYTTTGLIVPALPSNACVPIQSQSLYPSCNTKSGIECFLMVQEGGCTCAYKALMAEQSGYQFVIIYSPTSDKIKTMESGKYGSNVGQVMSVYVGKTAGNDLLNHNYSTGAEVTITPPPFFPNLEFYLIPFVIIVGICFVLMAMFMVSRYYRSFLEKRRNRITPANLKKIPTKKFKKGDVYYDVCAICLDEYKDGDKLRILPCDHVYHCKCVDPWLTEGKKTCPVCKRPVESKTTRNRSAVERGARQDIDSEADENTPLIQPSQTTSGGTIDV